MRRLSSSPSNDADDERGSAALEFLTAGLLLLLPLVYLVVAMSQLHGHALGAEAIARQAAHVLARTGSASEANEAVERAIVGSATEYGLNRDQVDVRLSCTPSDGACPQSGAIVRVEVTAISFLPLIPSHLGGMQVGAVPIEASAVQKVARFWDDG